MVGISPECLVSNLRPGNVVAGVASGSMDEPLPKVSTTLGLSGRELGVFSPFKTSRDPLFFPLPPSLRGHRNRGRLFGLETGLGLGLGLTDGQLSGSELGSPFFLVRSLSRLCLGLRNVSLSGELGALRMFRTSSSTLFGSDRTIDIEAVAEVSARVLVACFFLYFDFSFLSFLLGTGSVAYTTGVSPTGDRSLFSAMVFIQRGSWGSATATMDIKAGF